MDAALPFRNMIARLKIRCDFTQYGCKHIMSLSTLGDHLKNCNFNPQEVVQCQNGCDNYFKRQDLVRNPHNCIKELKKIIRKQEKRIHVMQRDQFDMIKRQKMLLWIVVTFLMVIGSIIIGSYLYV